MSVSFRYSKELGKCSLDDVLSNLVGYTSKRRTRDFRTQHLKIDNYQRIHFPGDAGPGGTEPLLVQRTKLSKFVRVSNTNV